MLKYVQSPFIDDKLYQDITALECVCMEYETLHFKLELSYKHEKWLTCKEEKASASYNEFLCYEDETLIGYVGISQFGGLDSIPEIMGMVHPNYRKSKIFTSLLDEVSDGRMWEVLTARYFSAICLPDCTVMHVTA